MHKDNAYEQIKQNLSADEDMIGFFRAHRPFKIWLIIFIGPLAVLGMKTYFVSVTSKGLHFNALNHLGQFSQYDFFTYDEIDSVKIGNGRFQIPMKYTFSNGRKLKIKAHKKGTEAVAKIDEKTLEFLKKNIQQT